MFCQRSGFLLHILNGWIAKDIITSLELYKSKKRIKFKIKETTKIAKVKISLYLNFKIMNPPYL